MPEPNPNGDASQRERWQRALDEARAAYLAGNAQGALVRFMDLLGEDPDPPFRGRALAGAGGILCHSGRGDLAGRLLREANRIAVVLDDQVLQLAIASNWSLLDLGRMAYGDVLRRTAALATMEVESPLHAQPMVAVLVNRASAAHEQREYGMALAALAAAERLVNAHRIGLMHLNLVKALQTRTLAACGRSDEAKLIADALPSRELTGLAKVYVRIARATIDEAERKHDQADIQFRGIAIDPTAPQLSKLAAQRGLIRVLVAKNDLDAALSELGHYCTAIVAIRGPGKGPDTSAFEQAMPVLRRLLGTGADSRDDHAVEDPVGRALAIVQASLPTNDLRELRALASTARQIALRGKRGDDWATACYRGELLAGVLQLDGLGDTAYLVAALGATAQTKTLIATTAYRLMAALGIQRDTVEYSIVTQREETVCGSGPLGRPWDEWGDEQMVGRVARAVCRSVVDDDSLNLEVSRMRTQPDGAGPAARWQGWCSIGEQLLRELTPVGNTYESIVKATAP